MSRARTRRPAVERLEDRCTPATGSGLLAHYFDNADLSNLKLTRTDPAVNFNWGTGSPASTIAADTFSVRWTGQVLAKATGPTTFHVTADDGVRLWVNGRLLVDRWTGTPGTPGTTYSGSLDLVAGRRYDLVMEHRENTGTASARLEWTGPTFARQVIPQSNLYPSDRGGLLREIYTGITGTTVANLTGNAKYPNSPDVVATIGNAQIGTYGDNYGQRLRGYFHAPTTGLFQFWISGDDNCQLWLSNSADASGKRLIATVPGWTNPLQWNKYLGAGQQRSVAIPLVAGQTYYLEALQKEGSGSDHLAVGWSPNGGAVSSVKVLPAFLLSPVRPTVQLYAEQAMSTEARGEVARFVVERTGAPLKNALTVTYAVGGSATAGSDYAALTGTVTIPAGQATAAVTLSALDDALVEGTEAVTLELRDAAAYNLGPLSSQTASATLTSDDFTPPAPGRAMLADPVNGFTAPNPAFGTRTVVVDAGPGFTQAVQLQTTASTPNVYDVGIYQGNAAALVRGEMLYLQFYARSAGSGTARFRLVFENATTYTNSVFVEETVGTTWTKYLVPFTSAEAYAAGQANLSFQAGFGPQTLRIGGLSLVAYGPQGDLLPVDRLRAFGSPGGSGYGTLVADAGPGFTQALEMVTTQRPTNPWDVSVRQKNRLPIAQGDSLLLEFYARATGPGTATIDAIFERAGAPYTGSLYSRQTVGSTWTLFRLPFTAVEAYGVEGAQVGFNVGFDPQTIRIGGVRLVNATTSAEVAVGAGDLANYEVYGSGGTAQNVAVSGAPGFTSAIQLTTPQPLPNPWDFQIVNTNDVPIRQGDSLYLEFYARGVGGNATLRTVFENGTTYVNSLFNETTVGTAWTLVRLPFTAAEAYATGAARVGFQAGFGPQTLQIGNARLVNVTTATNLEALPRVQATNTYGGRQAAATWRDDADARIAQTRQATLTVNVRNAAGQLLSGAQVYVRQNRHGFRFGSYLESDLIAGSSNPQSARYREEAKRLFNTATNTYYWPWLWDSATNRQLAFDALDWFKANDFAVRGHTIVWPARRWMPEDVWATYDSIRASQGDAAAADYLKTTIRDHVTEVAGDSHLVGQFYQWDVMNEPFANREVMDAPGVGDAEVREWYRRVRAADPTVARVLNDYDIFNNKADPAHQADYEYWARYLQANGVLEGLGEQAHYGEGRLPDLDQMQAVFDRYASLGLPIEITEFDVNAKDEQLQADFTRDYLKFMFSQEAVTGVVQWGFWEGRHWIPDAALYRGDWSIKPNGQAFEDLLYNEWWTDATGTTRGGQYATRGYQGEYEVVAVWNGQALTAQAALGAGGATVNLQFGGGPAGRSVVTIGVPPAEEPGRTAAPPEVWRAGRQEPPAEAVVWTQRRRGQPGWDGLDA